MSQSDPEHSQPDHGQHQSPLVIVSQDGRNTEASRRIVRAQAARASAAQSRVTRARNREEREGYQRDGHHPPSSTDLSRAGRALPHFSTEQDGESGQMPLTAWLSELALRSTSAAVNEAVQSSTPDDRSGGPLRLVTSDEARRPGSPGLRLPLATPKGFASLQTRIAVPDTLLYLLSRTACVDFASPGVENRLHELLNDLIVYTAASQPSHPVQCHLRVACACLTIFQGQRANDAVFAHNQKYLDGLDAAWSEATLLDINALSEPNAAAASLWAIFVISVTTGSTKDFFHRTLQALFHELQLRYWEQVRKVLLDFIYPVSFLDEPSKVFYQNLRRLEVA